WPTRCSDCCAIRPSGAGWATGAGGGSRNASTPPAAGGTSIRSIANLSLAAQPANRTPRWIPENRRRTLGRIRAGGRRANRITRMSVSVAHRGRPRGALFVAGAIAVASAIGVLAVVSPVLAVAATVGGVAVPAAVLRPKLVVHLLVVSIY